MAGGEPASMAALNAAVMAARSSPLDFVCIVTSLLRRHIVRPPFGALFVILLDNLPDGGSALGITFSCPLLFHQAKRCFITVQQVFRQVNSF